MPKLIDYAGRFDLIREAVFDITLRDGPAAISLQAVADELRLSVSSLRRVLRSADALPSLGLQWVELRQRKHLFDRLSRDVRASDELRRAADALFRLLPSTDEMADELRVWRSLIDAHGRESTWAQQARDDRNGFVDRTSQLLVTGLATDAENAQHEYERIRALLEGLTTLICERRLDPDIGAAVFRRHVTDLIAARRSSDAA